MKRLMKFFGRRWLAFLVLAGLVALRVWDPAQVRFIRENVWFDQFQKFDAYVPPQRHTVIVDIDEESLVELGQWPWSRYDLAKMVQILNQLGARVVGFDITFPELDKLSPAEFANRSETLPPELAEALSKLPSNDAILASVISQSKVVLGGSAYFREVKRESEWPPSARIAEINGQGSQWLPLYSDVVYNNPILQKATPGFGIFSIDPSSDGVVRRVPSMIRVGPPNQPKEQRVYPALSLEMLRLAHGEKGFLIQKANENSGISEIRMRSKVKEGGLKIPTDEHGILWVRFSRMEPSIYISARDIIRIDPANQAKVQELYNRINGKYVMVGTSAEGLKDIRATPLEGAMPGVEVHAQLLDMIENEDYIVRPSIASAIEIFVILVAGLVLVAFVPNLSAFTTVAFFVPFCLTLLGGSWYLYNYESILIGGLNPVVALFILFVLLTYQKYAREQEQKKQVRGAFAQYLSPALVEQLAEDPSRLTLGGETKTMTFLFCDIRGFTPISESFKGEPQGLTRLINKFLTPMTDIIMGNHGTIDKYMGDCIMAFWNAPLNDNEHPRHACESALLMQTELVALNERLKVEAEQEGRKFIPINIGIGVNTGDCVVGNMGSEQRFDYSVLGDAVNLASRLEGQSKGYGVINVIGESTAQTVQDFGIIELDLIAVKGKDEAVRIFTILGGPEYAQTDTYKALRPEADGLIAAYRERRFADAQAHLDRCKEILPERSGLWELYQERLDEYAVNPPPEDWDGVYRATSK
ncbi:MAG: adenylate/guanylate cyclase domain-containing protein [Pseudomonadota bacterium]|nr:adenylate/guanylate cyclase domain-containing protein [Pseudomonadota bacterium]